MFKQNVKLLTLCLFAMLTFSVAFTSCGDPEPEACDEIVYDASGGSVEFNGEMLKLTENSSYIFLDTGTGTLIQRTFSINFTEDDCENAYSIILQLIGEVQSSYDLATLAVGTSSIVYIQREPLVADSQGLKSGTLNLEDKGDGVWNIDIDGIDQSDNEVKFQVEYDFD